MQYASELLIKANQCDEDYTPKRYKTEFFGIYKFICTFINRQQQTQLRDWFNQMMNQFEAIIKEKENMS